DAQTAEGGASNRAELAATGLAKASAQEPAAMAPQVTLPPPDELIRLWPWERFHIELPSPKELARLGTHQRRRHRRSDGTGVSTDGATGLSSGGVTTGGSTDGNRGSDGVMDGGGRGQQRSGQPPPPTATRGGKARGGCRQGARGREQTPLQLPARRRKKRGTESMGFLVKDEQQHSAGDEAKGSHDDADLSAAAHASASTVSKPPRRRAGRGGKPLHGNVSRPGRKRAAEAAAATELTRQDGEDASGVLKDEEATRRQPKRPRRAATAVAAAAQSRDEEQTEQSSRDTSSLSPLAGCRRSRSRRQLHVADPDGEDEGSADAEVPSREMRSSAIVDKSDGGAAVPQGSQKGVGASESAPNMRSLRLNVHPAFTRPPEPSHPPAAGEPETTECAPRAASSATGTHAAPGSTTAPDAAAAPLRKRRLKDLIAVPPYSCLVRQPVPVDISNSTTASATAAPLGPDLSGLPPDAEPFLRTGLGSGLRLLDSSKSDGNTRFNGRAGEDRKDLGRSAEPMAPVIRRDEHVSRVVECGQGSLVGVTDAAVVASPTLQPPAPAAPQTLQGIAADTTSAGVGRPGNVAELRPEDAGAIRTAGADGVGGRGFMSNILSRILADEDL
ncbi:hypothetical protein Vretifemale_2013, partial [Volvox reticuliferus]